MARAQYVDSFSLSPSLSPSLPLSLARSRALSLAGILAARPWPCHLLHLLSSLRPTGASLLRAALRLSERITQQEFCGLEEAPPSLPCVAQCTIAIDLLEVLHTAFGTAWIAFQETFPSMLKRAAESKGDKPAMKAETRAGF